MPDHIVQKSLASLYAALAQLKLNQKATFVLVTPDPPPQDYWDELTTYLANDADVQVTEIDKDAGLITIRCTATSLRQLVESDLRDGLIGINDDQPN